MKLAFRIAADVTVVCHLAYAAFILLGQLAIVVGALRGWRWVRGFRFRMIHLAAILIVVAESLTGVVCPLTTLEKWLRTQAGEATYQGDFLANWAHDVLFVDASETTLAAIYVVFGLLVVGTLWLVPPERNQKSAQPVDEQSVTNHAP